MKEPPPETAPAAAAPQTLSPRLKWAEGWGSWGFRVKGLKCIGEVAPTSVKPTLATYTTFDWGSTFLACLKDA